MAAFVAALCRACSSFSSNSFRHPTVLNWSSTGICRRTPGSPTPMSRWLSSSVNNLREMTGSSIGRPTWEPARRGSFSRSICRLPTAGLVRWSSSPTAASQSVTGFKDQFEGYLRKTFPGTDTYVKLLEVGPPVGRPVQYRLGGQNIAKVKEFSESLAAIVRSNPHLNDVVFDWMEPARVVKADVLQDKARQLGVSSEDIAGTLNSVLNGTSITQVRDSIYLINVVDRATAAEHASIEHAAGFATHWLGRSIGAARRRRHHTLRNRAADDMAAVAASHDHPAIEHP